MSVDEPNEVPEVWRPYFAQRRISFTFRDLHRNVEGVSLNTVRRALLGIGSPSRRVVNIIAGALGIDDAEFQATRAKVNGTDPTTPFTLPARADLLNQRERDAILDIVGALLDARDRYADQSDNNTDPSKKQGASCEADQVEKTWEGDSPHYIVRMLTGPTKGQTFVVANSDFQKGPPNGEEFEIIQVVPRGTTFTPQTDQDQNAGAGGPRNDQALIGSDQGEDVDADGRQSDHDLAARRGGGKSATRAAREEQDREAEGGGS